MIKCNIILAEVRIDDSTTESAPITEYSAEIGQPLHLKCLQNGPTFDPRDLAERGGIPAYFWRVGMKGTANTRLLDANRLLQTSSDEDGVYGQSRFVIDRLTGKFSSLLWVVNGTHRCLLLKTSIFC